MLKARQRPALYILVTCASLAILYFYCIWSFDGPTVTSIFGSSSSIDLHKHTLAWQFDPQRDANNHALSDEQCSTAFPDLYQEIDRAAAHRADHHIQLPELEIEVDKCLVRLLIYDREIFIVKGAYDKGGDILGDHCWVSHKGWQQRISGLLHSLDRALSSSPYSPFPNTEFVLDFDDDPMRPLRNIREDDANTTAVWALTRRNQDKNIWLMPDYSYWAWPAGGIASHTDLRRQIAKVNADHPWEQKVSKAVWRGNVKTRADIRKPLVAMTTDAEWADVKHCDGDSEKYCLPMADMCRYKFPIHTEGYSYSARLRYLQHCLAAPIVHELEYLEHHTHLMKSEGPDQNFIQVKRNRTDLEEKTTHYIKHDDKAHHIALNSYNTFGQRYLTPAATSCYWRRLVQTWAKVQAFEPELYTVSPKTGKEELRGMPFAAWVAFKEYTKDPETVHRKEKENAERLEKEKSQRKKEKAQKGKTQGLDKALREKGKQMDKISKEENTQMGNMHEELTQPVQEAKTMAAGRSRQS